jgi:hypothetical protein
MLRPRIRRSREGQKVTEAPGIGVNWQTRTEAHSATSVRAARPIVRRTMAGELCLGQPSPVNAGASRRAADG